MTLRMWVIAVLLDLIIGLFIPMGIVVVGTLLVIVVEFGINPYRAGAK